MPTIPASLFVDVLPSVLAPGGSALDLNGLVLTTNPRVPIGTVASFPNDGESVADYFGASADETRIANVYFNGYDTSTRKPNAILFAQYPIAPVGAYLRGGDISSMPLATLQSFNATLDVTIDGSLESASINLSAVTSFANAAAFIGNALGIVGPSVASSITGSVAGSVLTVTAITGELGVGAVLSGSGLNPGTYIAAQITSTEGDGHLGGTGTYSVVGTVANGGPTYTAEAPGVYYDSTSGAFVVQSSTTGASSTITFGSGAMAPLLLLTQATGAVLSQGAIAAIPATFMNAIKQQTMDWASFTSIFDPDEGVGNTQKLAFAAWTSDQDERFIYVPWDTDLTALAAVPAVTCLGYLIQQAQYSGIAPVWALPDAADGGTGADIAAFVCGSIASLDFSAVNGRTSFAFRSQAGLLASVTDATSAVNLGGDPAGGSFGNGYNYYGAVSTANQGFVFLQRGTVSGPFKWLDSFANQIWLNNAFQLALLSFLTQVNAVPYTPAGDAQIEAALADAINAGLSFGAFSAGVTLSSTQIAQINAMAGARIASIIQTRGWYLQIRPASPAVRAARSSPPMTFWYADAGSVQQITLASVEIQ